MMSKAKQEIQPQKPPQSEGSSTMDNKQLGGQAGLSKLASNSAVATENPSIQTQAAQLNDTRIPTVQRQTMASSIGKIGGNQHLQRVVAQIPATLQRTPLIQKHPDQQKKILRNYPWLGKITAWSTPLHSTPEITQTNIVKPPGDLPKDTEVVVKGYQRGCYFIEVFVAGEKYEGYVSHELVQYKKSLLKGEISPASAFYIRDSPDNSSKENILGKLVLWR